MTKAVNLEAYLCVWVVGVHLKFTTVLKKYIVGNRIENVVRFGFNY